MGECEAVLSPETSSQEKPLSLFRTNEMKASDRFPVPLPVEGRGPSPPAAGRYQVSSHGPREEDSLETCHHSYLPVPSRNTCHHSYFSAPSPVGILRCSCVCVCVCVLPPESILKTTCESI